jgi:multicomponent Na+:H+ antiporter subunit E
VAGVYVYVYVYAHTVPWLKHFGYSAILSKIYLTKLAMCFIILETQGFQNHRHSHGEGWHMSKSNIVIVLTLTFVWIILVESLSPVFIISGIAISIACVFFAKKYLPLQKIEGVDFNKLATYPFFLVGQILTSGIYVSKIILFGAKTDIVEVQSAIENESLRVMLADSVTLTPGSLLLELSSEKMTILWLRPKDAPDADKTENPGHQIMGEIEARLLKAEKRG